MLVQISWLTIYGIHGVTNQRTKLWGPQLVANDMDQDYNDCKVKSLLWFGLLLCVIVLQWQINHIIQQNQNNWQQQKQNVKDVILYIILCYVTLYDSIYYVILNVIR